VWHDREKRRRDKMLTIQRTESLRGGEGYNPPGTHLLSPVGASVAGWKPAERSVSFNRDVHVKRIGESRPYHTIQNRDISCIRGGASEREREREREMALLDWSEAMRASRSKLTRTLIKKGNAFIGALLDHPPRGTALLTHQALISITRDPSRIWDLEI